MQEGFPIAAFAELATQGIFYILLFVFAVHLLIVTYHWFSYGTSRTTGLTALIIYLAGSGLCFLIMLVSLTAI